MDNDGNVVNQISYDSFGRITNESNPSVDLRFGYVGKELDSETGLRHNGARYVDGDRFISEDPIGFEGGDTNLYRYVNNSPLNYVDPEGFCGAIPFENDNDLDISLNEPVIDLIPDLDISLSEPIVDLIPDLNFDFPNHNTFEVAGEITWPNPVGVLTGIGGVAVGVGKWVWDQTFGNDDNDDLNPDYFESSNPINPPQELPAFPNADKAKPKTPVQGGGKLRKRWKDNKGKIYEWDYQHGTVEIYNKKGKHLGEFDPQTGEQIKPADKKRSVEP